MRIGMIVLFAILYIALIALFLLGYKKKQKKVWVTSSIISNRFSCNYYHYKYLCLKNTVKNSIFFNETIYLMV